jgi:hypothetical protein
MDRRCDACGRTGGVMIGMGGALICRKCDPDVRAEMERLRAEGRPVNVMHIARRIFRETNKSGDYLLRDIPADLWARAQDRAAKSGETLRDLILRAIERETK